MTRKNPHKQSLPNQLEFNAAIAASIRDAVIGTDNNLIVISWNKGAEHMYDIKARDIIGKHVREAYTTKLLDISLAQWRKIMREKGYWKGTATQTLKNEKTIIVSSSTATVYDKEGHPIGLVAVNKDITKYKQTRELLMQQNKKFYELIENLQQAYISMDRDFRFLASNKYNTQMTGKSPKELIGKKWNEVYPEVVGSLFWNTAKRALKEQKPQSIEACYEPLKKWYRVDYYPTQDRIDTIVTDITEQKMHEQQKDNFIAMISHELKSPLTSAKIFMNVLQKLLHAHNDPQLEKIADKVNTQITILVGLVEDILLFNNIQHGNFAKLKKQEFYLKDLVEEVVEDIRLMTTKELSMDWHTRYPIYADRQKLREVFVNLLTNALKYSPQGQKVILSSKKVSDTLIISVQDFGIGIPKDKQDKIFDRFYQVEEHATYPGIGLGLYICNEIIKMHKGKMWVKSEEGKGSTFYFSLPIYKK